MIFFYGCVLIVAVFFIIVTWRIMVKAGYAGWCSLIPVYNSYVMLKVSCMSGWWLLLYLAIGVVGQIPVNILSDYLWLVIPLGIAYLAVAFWQGYRLGRAFGKSTGFCIFSAILTPIAQIILAFDKSEWRDLDEPDWNQEIEA